MPFLVDLLEVNAVLDDAAVAGEEEHVAEGTPAGVDEASQSAEDQEMKPPRGSQVLPWPRIRGLRHKRSQKNVLQAENQLERERETETETETEREGKKTKRREEYLVGAEVFPGPGGERSIHEAVDYGRGDEF